MMNGSALMRKEHFKKNVKTKYATPGSHTPNEGSVTAIKSGNKGSNKKAKVEKIIEGEFVSSKKGKECSKSSKRTQSTVIPTVKANNSVQRSVSTVKKNRSKSKKDKHRKKFQQYTEVKAATQNLVAEGIETTRSFFPLTHNEKQSQTHRSQLKSYLIGQDGEKHECQEVSASEEEELTDSIQRAVHLPEGSEYIGRIPQSYKNFYEQSRQEKVPPREEWQAMETLRLKNQELTNYIEQMQKAEKKNQEQNEWNRLALENRYIQEKKILLSQINELKEEKSKLTDNNANLQQMFNEGKQQLDQMTHKCQYLEREHNALASQKRGEGASMSRVGEEGRIAELESELSYYRSVVEQLKREKQQFQRTLNSVRYQKQAIKDRATQLLSIIHSLKQEQLSQKSDE